MLLDVELDHWRNHIDPRVKSQGAIGGKGGLNQLDREGVLVGEVKLGEPRQLNLALRVDADVALERRHDLLVLQAPRELFEEIQRWLTTGKVLPPEDGLGGKHSSDNAIGDQRFHIVLVEVLNKGFNLVFRGQRSPVQC